MAADINKVDLNLLEVIEGEEHLLAMLTEQDKQEEETALQHGPEELILHMCDEENPLADLENY